jgi:anti-anti-sigma factor
MPTPPPALEIEVEYIDQACMIRTQGELDIASAPALEDALLHALDSRAASILLDLGRVSFIDSMGLRVLAWAANQSREDGDRLRIDCGSGPVRRMLELTSLDARLPLIAEKA